MKILSRYVFREILASSFLATILATFVIFLKNISWIVELLVRSGNVFLFLELCALSLPPVLLLSIPFGVLVGILVGLGRMSSDNEIVALRSGGVSSRVVAPPVLFFATLAMIASGACAVWLNPLAIRGQLKLRNTVGVTQVTADVVPQVFQEQFTNDNTVLYVRDVISGVGPTVWKGVFIADLTPPKTGLKNQPVGPKITVAEEAIAVPDALNNRIQLTLRNQSVHETLEGGGSITTRAPRAALAMQQNPPEQQKAKPYREMLTKELAAFIKVHPKGSQENIDARIELDGRFALPVACIMLALVGIPLGASSRRGGRSAGYIWAILLGFFCYYLAYGSLTNTASRSHSISPELASWLPDLVFGVAGLAMIARMEIPGDRDLIGGVRMAFNGWFARFSGRLVKSRESSSSVGLRFVIFQLMDSYVLSNFMLFFCLWLAAFVTMTQVYNFFELLGDIVKNRIPLSRVLYFHLFLTPQLIHDVLPIAVLLAVLVTFGVMTKNNEVTAFKACGISVRRLGLPVLLMSGILSAALFAADYSWIPEANQRQDAIHNEIKGRPVQTYLHPERKWAINHDRIFYFRGFDASEKLMIEPYVFELNPKTFQLVRQINATRARWEPTIKQWIWEQGAARDIHGVDEKIETFTVTSFPEITEVPDDFLIAAKQNQQMNYNELGDYVKYLSDRGFDTVKLRVQYHKKFAVPVFALIMALISVPFGFLVGNRGAMAGIGVSIGIAMTYLLIDKLFEQMGNVNYLPATVAAWTPDALFSLAGVYMMLRMRS